MAALQWQHKIQPTASSRGVLKSQIAIRAYVRNDLALQLLEIA